jgi:UDP-glucose 4-epimerase
MKILITGGAGYIGSHTCVELLNAGHDLVVFDNFCNSRAETLERVSRITAKPITHVRGDLRDKSDILKALRNSDAAAVVHCAGLKAVGESEQYPLAYYSNNVTGTIHLLEAMDECNIKTLVFSSSATVYGNPKKLPLTEDHPLSTNNPYGQTKLVIEDLLRYMSRSDAQWRIAILRYFNPAGAHRSGLIGEDPQGMPNNLMPYIAQVAVGKRTHINIWGNDYNTPDGTGVRDYIHVVDLARGHLLALDYLNKQPGCEAINLGTGVGYSVLDMVGAFEQACGKELPYRMAPRRDGDVATCYANPAKAAELLGWHAKHGLRAMCVDAWRWQSGRDPFARSAVDGTMCQGDHSVGPSPGPSRFSAVCTDASPRALPGQGLSQQKQTGVGLRCFPGRSR